METWDDLLFNLAANMSRKKLDPKKHRLYEREEKQDRLKDPKSAAAFLKGIKQREGGE